MRRILNLVKKTLYLLGIILVLSGFSSGPYQYVDPYNNTCVDDTGLCYTRWGCCGSGNWVWPTKSKKLDVRGFSGSHPAIDIVVNNGDHIYAVDNGIINWAGYSTWGYGNLVIINHGYRQTYYAHLGEVYVSCGQYVRRGQIIATVDNTLGKQGASVNPHLHFEYRIDGNNYNPWLMFQEEQVRKEGQMQAEQAESSTNKSVVIGN